LWICFVVLEGSHKDYSKLDLHHCKELEKETLNNKLTELLEIFQTDELSLEEITEEVEIVHSQIYNKKHIDI
jgi:predicted DNA-binding protein YlxM (UPF0122 family)